MEGILKELLDNYHRNDGNLISLLQETQERFGYLPEEAIYWFSERLNVPPSKFFGIATFYAQFHLKPRGKNIISVCCGTACHVKGGSKITERIMRELGLTSEGETTEDGKFTLEVVRCVGACGIAHVVIINNKVYPEMTPERTARIIKKLHDEEEANGKK